MEWGGAWKGAAPRGQEASGEEGGPRSEECADQELTPSCFSHDSPHNLA